MGNSDLTVEDHTHWFISDTHLGHTGILKLADRPYVNLREHDQEIVTNWNAMVKPKDTVWHLSDVAGEDVPFDHVQSIFKRLNGVRRLIVGNHDGESVQTKLDWVSVDIMRTIVAPGCKVVLCHYPLLEWDGYLRR